MKTITKTALEDKADKLLIALNKMSSRTMAIIKNGEVVGAISSSKALDIEFLEMISKAINEEIICEGLREKDEADLRRGRML